MGGLGKIRQVRSSTLGRLVLVGALGLFLYTGWCLAVRPYPDGSCDAPLTVSFSDPVDLPRERTITETRPDYGEILRRLDRGELVSKDDPRFQHEVTYTDNLGDVAAARAEQRRLQACKEQLSTAGFWWRGTAPVIVSVAAGLVLAFVFRGGPKEELT